MATKVLSSEKKTEGIVTTLTITVCHSAYWLTVRPGDICVTRDNLAFSVERVTLEGGAGKVTVAEIIMRLAETNTPLTAAAVNWETYWGTVL